jgi:hypothetical protein
LQKLKVFALSSHLVWFDPLISVDDDDERTRKGENNLGLEWSICFFEWLKDKTA